MVREDQDIPKSILDESGHFTLKSAMNFFLEPGVLVVGVNSFRLHLFRLPKL